MKTNHSSICVYLTECSDMSVLRSAVLRCWRQHTRKCILELGSDFLSIRLKSVNIYTIFML